MTRTQIQLPDSLYERAKQFAAASELSLAEITRRGIELYLERYPPVDLIDLVFDLMVEHDGVEAAYRLVREELRRSQTLLGLDKLLEAQLMLAPPERQPDMQLVKNLIHAHARRMTRYACENCGFKARQFFWHCPGCGGWETYPPRRAEELNPAT